MHIINRTEGRQKTIIQKEYLSDGHEVLEYLQFPKLQELEQIEHLFTTRTGGVSRAHLRSMNLSFTRGDEPENVLENYRRIGKVLGCSADRFVASDQTHTTNIRIVSAEDAGKGVVRERDYSDIDGLITEVAELPLACFYADCVPLYFVDPVRKVIGLAHSGWKGTAAGIGACMVQKMQEVFGCHPEDMAAAIGPSICRDCYEISEDVARYFQGGFWAEPKTDEVCREIFASGIYPAGEILKAGKEEGKYQLDLWLANLIVLARAGIRLSNIDVTDVCTCCNPEYLFSHRASRGLRGNLAAFLMLRKN